MMIMFSFLLLVCIFNVSEMIDDLNAILCFLCVLFLLFMLCDLWGWLCIFSSPCCHQDELLPWYCTCYSTHSSTFSTGPKGGDTCYLLNLFDFSIYAFRKWFHRCMKCRAPILPYIPIFAYIFDVLPIFPVFLRNLIYFLYFWEISYISCIFLFWGHFSYISLLNSFLWKVLLKYASY